MGSQYHSPDRKKQLSDEFSNELIQIKNLADLKLCQFKLEQQNEYLQTAAQEISQILEKYHQFFHMAPVGFFCLDKNALILNVNDAGAKLLGLAKEKLVNQCFSRYITPEYNHIFSNFRQQVLKSDNEESCELKLMKRNGPIFSAYIVSKQITRSDNDKEILVVLTNISIKNTDLQDEQLQLELAEKANTIDTMLTNIVHELNHPLSVITNFVQGAIRRLESEKYDLNQVLTALKKAVQQSDRAADIILRMKKFNYRTTTKQEKININSLLKETIELIQYETFGYSVAVLFRPCPNNIIVNVDKAHIQQVIINLSRNAIEAMKDAQTISPKIAIECVQISKNQVEISVIDNGPGFDKENSHNLVSPGFTTKAYGVGLGLTMSRKMIETHGGKLSMELNTTDGACFKFTLPLCKEVPA